MGAICGIVLPDGQGSASAQGERMFHRLAQYRFDAVGGYSDQGVYFGCGVMHDTPESRLEELPRRDATQHIWLAADAIIDNRADLMAAFGIAPSLGPSITDSEFILMAYERWGHLCPKHLIGDYAFAIWDAGKKELFLARDPMGSRTLYYTRERGAIAFCTVERPLLDVWGRKPSLNERWLADFLAIDGIQHQISYDETVYSGIYQLMPAYSGVFKDGELALTKYWDPLKDHPPVRYESDEQYERAFLDLFAEAVACRTRSAGETGVMLSGGMDSGSIACVAAKQLQETKRRLYAFCSVPSESFGPRRDKKSVFNEAEQANLVVQAYPNIEMTYCSFDGRSAMTDIDELVRIFAQPYKVFRNMTWYRPMLQLAAERNCRVMLNGQVGNSTISYGDFRVHLTTLLRSGRWMEAGREAAALSRLLQAPAKKVAKRLLPQFIPYRIRHWKNRLRRRNFDRFRNVIVNRAFIRKWDLERRLDAVYGNLQTPKYLDYEQTKALRIHPMHFTHIGAIETKLSLANRIAIRDPSRDRRIVEFCLSIPSSQFVRNGNERFLLRRAMRGILPEPIRTNRSTIGIQGADWLHRLQPEWDALLAELDGAIADPAVEPFVDIEKVKEVRRRLEEHREGAQETDVTMGIIAIIVRKFMTYTGALSEEKEEAPSV